jgi:hypothetical protein
MDTAAFNRGATLAEKRTEQLKGKFAAVGKSLAGVGVGLASGFAAVGLNSVVASAFDMASSLSEAAEKAGVTIEALQELRFAAQQTGVSNEAMDASLGRLTRTLGDLQMGAPAAAKAFDQIGLSAEQLEGLPTGEAFRLIAEQIAKIPDPTQRAAAAVDIFGKSGQQLMPILNGGAKAIDEFAAASRRNGQISTQDAQKLDELADSWETLKVRVGVATANVIAAVVPMGEAVIATFDSWEAAMGRAHDAIVGMANGAVNAIRNMVTSIGNWITGRLNAIWDGLTSRLNQIRRMFGELGGKIGVSFDGAGAGFQRIGLSLTSTAEGVTGGISRSFADMAEGVLSSLNRVSSATKGGGFLDILGSVVGLGLQLGGLGAFGKGVAANINGQSGAGYVRPSAGGNSRAPTIQVNPSPYFDVVVDSRVGRAAPTIMQGGASIARAEAARSNKWSLA